MSRSVLLLATWSIIQSVLASRCDIIGITLEVLQHIECEHMTSVNFCAFELIWCENGIELSVAEKLS